MAQFKRILVVFDPTVDSQPALQRAADVASGSGADIHLYCCLDKGAPRRDRVERLRQLLEGQKDALEALASLLREQGLSVQTEVEWHTEWAPSVVAAARRVEADAVFKSCRSHPAGQRVLKHAGDWHLMRECNCPVLLVRGGTASDKLKILAAVDIQADRGHYARLNSDILELSRKVADGSDADVHVVNAFQDFRAVPDRGELVEGAGVDRDHVHIQHGKPEKVIVDKARELDASLVVIGNSGRSGIPALVIGNTVEKVLGKLDCDVLAIN